MPLLDLQVRFRELGRIRAGEKGPKGEPRKLTNWRLTSASRTLLDHAAAIYGGTVREWTGAPNEGTWWELLTASSELRVVLPPVGDPAALLTQNYEEWKGGGAVHRCDGVTDGLTGKPCSCDPENRKCKPVTRLSVMLPDIPDIGIWRLDTHGINAALELPGTFNLLYEAAGGSFIEAILRLEPRTSKQDGQTRRFVVPVLAIEHVSASGLIAAATGAAPALTARGERPALAAASEPPAGDEAAFAIESPADHPEPPPLPDEPEVEFDYDDALDVEPDESAGEPAPEPDDVPAEETPPTRSPSITTAQRRKIFAAARAKGVSEERLRELVGQVNGGEESTAALSKRLLEPLLTAIAAEPDPDPEE